MPRKGLTHASVEPGSDLDRVAKALYDHDALRATTPWHPWIFATGPKRLRYLARASAAIAALEPPTCHGEAPRSRLSADASPERR